MQVPTKNPREDSSSAKSNRYVSLLPVLSKLTEHIFVTRLQQFYTDTFEEFGFRLKHYTVHQLLTVVESIYDGFDSSEIASTLFIDIAKAFGYMETKYQFRLIF